MSELHRASWSRIVQFGVIIIKGAALILSLVFLAMLINGSDLQYGPEALKRWADAEVRGAGLAGALLFIAVGAAFTGIGLSRQVFAFVAGYIYGVGIGTTYALTAEMAGVVLGFGYARFFARDMIVRRYPNRVRKIDDFLHLHPFSMTLAVRLFPLGHNLVVNLLAGVSKVRALPFLAASAVGHLPQTLVFAMVGGGVAESDMVKGALAAALFALSAGIGMHLYRKYRRGRVFVDEDEGAGLDVELVETQRSQGH
jgi:uncharacterized membrane protein YdjX (TVP38/TMEM64 family)